MAWQDSPEGLSPDWVFSNNSNRLQRSEVVHRVYGLSKHRSITVFFFSSQGVSVVGVGIVNLPLKRGPNFRGPRAHLVLLLMEVLYIPSYTCNIVGSTVLEMTREIVTSGGNEKSRGRIIDTNGNQIGYFSPNTKNTSFPCLRLSGPPVGPRLGPSRFKSGVAYFLSIHWPEGERERWRARGEQDKTATEKLQWIGDQPYTAEEKEWLKKHYKGEYKFLMTHGLSIFDEEDRAEGRAIMRTLAKYDESQDKNDEEDDVDDGDDQNREIEDEDEEEDDDSDLEGHLADHHFNEEELDWIEKHYRNSATFMFSHGLKFYDDEHCKTAKTLVQHFLEE